MRLLSALLQMLCSRRHVFRSASKQVRQLVAGMATLTAVPDDRVISIQARHSPGSGAAACVADTASHSNS